MNDVQISAVRAADAGEILTLQRSAYVTEAQLYGEPMLPPLTQTFAELVAELGGCIAVKATSGHRIVGAGRGRVDGSILHIGRLTVAPDMQGKGIGTRLVDALEQAAPPGVRQVTLFTGHLSAGNIRLYERLGYVESRREQLSPGVTLVHLDKPLHRDG